MSSTTFTQPRDITALVSIPDAGLEAAVRDALGKPTGDLSAADLAGLTRLVAESRRITNLAGIDHFTNLTSLKLYGNHITDISPLARLTNLTELSLRNNQVTDISPLADLTSLSALYLDQGNQISDISPLSRLTRLEYLYLSGNQIEDASPLESLLNLKELRVDNNQIRSISSLRANGGLGQGDQLWIHGNPLDLSVGSDTQKDIEALKNRGVDVRHDVLPPGSVQAQPPEEPPLTDGFWTQVWWIFGVVVILGMALRVLRGRQKRRRLRFIPGVFIEDDDDD